MSKYTGNRIPSYYFYLSLLAIFIIGFILVKLVIYLERPIIIDPLDKNVFTAESWKKIKVKVEDIQIISSPYYKEIPKSSSKRVRGLDALSNDGGVKWVKIEIIYLTYKSKDKTYKQLVNNMNEIDMKLVLSNREYVDLFINKNDENDYYFDL